jgi:cold shock CspA family protein
MIAGTIGRWNPKGYAFVTRDDGGPNIFIHARQMAEAGIVPQDTGVLNIRVSFDIATRQEDGKFYAHSVKRLP